MPALPLTSWLAQAPDLVTPAAAAAEKGLLDLVNPFLPVFFAAFFASILATPVMRKLAVRNGIIDWPDLKRKAHLAPVAYLGGLGICIGWVVGVAICFFPPISSAFPIEIILGAAAITITGLFDDIYGIRARVKVGGQLFAAAALASVTLTPGGDAIGVELMRGVFGVVGFQPPATITYAAGTVVIAVFVLGGCNAVNLIDGLDGLASGVTAIATGGFLVIAAIVALGHINSPEVATLTLSDTARVVMCLAILGAIAGFLPYNFNPATIFMGDAGSLLLGYLAMTTILLFADTRGEALKIVTACLIVFALPITDTSLAIVRRKIRGQPIFAPDAQHIHHLLRKRGLSVKKAVLVMYTMGILFAALGVAMIALDLRWRNVLVVFVVLYGFIMVTAFKVGQQQLIREKLAEEAALGRVSAEPGVGPGLDGEDDSRPAEAPAPGEEHAGHPHAKSRSRTAPGADAGSEDTPASSRGDSPESGGHVA